MIVGNEMKNKREIMKKIILCWHKQEGQTLARFGGVAGALQLTIVGKSIAIYSLCPHHI